MRAHQPERMTKATAHNPQRVSRFRDFCRYTSFGLVLILAIVASPILANGQGQTFKIPPVKIPLNIKDQHIAIVASGTIAMARKDHGLNEAKVELTADLSDLQHNMTGLLSSALDKDNPCGDRILIQSATLTPIEPASLSVVQLHYERWACVKLFGKQEVKKMIGGNALIKMKLTPAVGPDQTELQLVPELEPIEADGSLGEFLRMGNIGEMLRDQIQAAILAALKKGVDLNAILPGAVKGDVTIQDVRFRDAGSGSLALTLVGQAQITNDQLQALSKQAKARLPLH